MSNLDTFYVRMGLSILTITFERKELVPSTTALLEALKTELSGESSSEALALSVQKLWPIYTSA